MIMAANHRDSSSGNREAQHNNVDFGSKSPFSASATSSWDTSGYSLSFSGDFYTDSTISFSKRMTSRRNSSDGCNSCHSDHCIIKPKKDSTDNSDMNNTRSDTYRPLQQDPQPTFAVRVWICLSVILAFCVLTLVSLGPICTQYFSYRIARDKYNISINATDDQASSVTAACEGNSSSTFDDLRNQVQREAASIMMYASLWSGIPAMFVCLLVGSYSDYIGRKPLVLVSITGLLCRLVTLALIIQLELPPRVYYLGCLLDGLAGSAFTLQLAVTAAVADITPRVGNLAARFALLEGCLMVVSALAQMATGYMINLLGYLAPVAVQVCLVSIALLLTVCQLPETMQCKREIIYNPFVHLKKVFGFYFLDGSTKLRCQFSVGLLLYFTIMLTAAGRQTVEILFVMNSPICWNSVDIGIFNSIRMVVHSVLAVSVLRYSRNILSLEVIGILGCLSAVAGFIFQAFATSTDDMYISALIGALLLTIVPVPKALLSIITEPTQQGALFSGLSAVETFSAMLSNTMYTQLYNDTVAYFKGFVFLVMAGLCVLIGTQLSTYRLLRRSREKHFKLDVKIDVEYQKHAEDTPLLTSQ